MIFQDPISSLNPRRKVRDSVKDPLDIWDRGTTEPSGSSSSTGCSEQVGIDPDRAAESRPHQFSGGQCQRISIATGARARSDADHLRRAGLGSRRQRAGPGAQPARGPQGQVRTDADLHRPRPRGGQEHQRPGRRDVPRQAVRGRLQRRSVQPSGAPVHATCCWSRSRSPTPTVAVAGTTITGEPPSPVNPPSGCRFHPRCPYADEVCSQRPNPACVRSATATSWPVTTRSRRRSRSPDSRPGRRADRCCACAGPKVDAPRSLRAHAGHVSCRFRRSDDSVGRRGIPACGLDTPDGPGTLRLTWGTDPAPVDDAGLSAEAWGPGADWLLTRVDALTGARRSPGHLSRRPPGCRAGVAVRTRWPESVPRRRSITTSCRRSSPSGSRPVRPCASGNGCAVSSASRRPARPIWSRDCCCHRRPPACTADRRGGSTRSASKTKRARPLVEVARHADKLWGWTASGSDMLAQKLSLIRGIGPWTIGSVLGPVFGDPDAVPVGDFHFPNTVAWAIDGQARADDDRMLELLEPYRGQRGRVLWSIVTTAGKAPAFGPRKRILPMSKW